MTASRYDKVAYTGRPFPQTHPDRLATLATLFGMQPPALSTCRVLELGCGDGANLLPMAAALPMAQFTGIDIAQRAIERAQSTAASIELHNVLFQCADIAEMSLPSDKFDYILAHGLFSWVAPEVQEKIFALIRATLAPQGVAYISYNAYPGGHLRDMARAMARFHVAHLADASRQVDEARALIKFIADARPEHDTYRDILTPELERMTCGDDGYVFHDDLAEINIPFYFHEFMSQADRHGLQFLAEADFAEMHDGQFKPEITATLRQLTGDALVMYEQYADFLKCRKFRQTLLCQSEVTLDRENPASRLSKFHVAAPLQFEASKRALDSSTTEVRFQHPSGPALTTAHPHVKAALGLLGEAWPEALPFEELVARTRKRCKLRKDQAADNVTLLSEAIFEAYGRNVVSLHVLSTPAAAHPGPRPSVSALARWQAKHGSRITTLRHETIELEDARARNLVQLLDGSRDRAQLVDALVACEGHMASAERIHLHTQLHDGLESKLNTLARLALLTA